MKKPAKAHSPCPAESAMLHVGGKWKLAILWQLSSVDRYRYGELRKLVSAASERVFIRQLRELEQSGLISKTSYPVVPPKVEYAITEVGRELVPVIDQLTSWASRNRFHEVKSERGERFVGLIRHRLDRPSVTTESVVTPKLHKVD